MHGRKTFITRHSVIKRRSDLIMHLSSRIDDLRLSCSLTQALMPLESIANLNDAITFSLTCGLRTVYLINFKNFICVDIVKCQVKFCLLLDFLRIILFLTIIASTGGLHEISRRAACGLDITGIDTI